MGTIRIQPLTIAAALLGAACTSDREEREWGERLAAEVSDRMTLLPDGDPTTRWARRVLASLVPASARFRAPTAVGGYQVDVIDTPLVNAFALPGGHLYLTTGLILAAADCAEVAGVLGHEMGHVVERHAVESLQAQQTGTWLSRLVFGGGSGAEAAGAAFAVLEGTAFNRRDEVEADEVGVRIAGESGYDPAALARFMDRAFGDRPGDFFDTHPPTAERRAALDREIADRFPGAPPAGVDCPPLAEALASVQARLRGGRP